MSPTEKSKTPTDRDLAYTKHKYKLLSGKEAVNVTAISGLMDDGKSAAFAGAAVKLTKEGKNHREEWKAKGDRGTRIHGHMEAFLRGEAIQQAEDEAGFVDGLEKFLVENDPEPVEIEGVVLSELGYGGRFDMVVRTQGAVTLLDLKTGSPYVVEHTLQLAAYRYADGIAVYDEQGKLIRLRPVPLVVRAGCVYVHENGTYDLRYFPADRDAFDAFCALLEAYKWTRSTDIKEAVKLAKVKA